jgi:DNA-binding LacI/PurR family transcriptional regulator
MYRSRRSKGGEVPAPSTLGSDGVSNVSGWRRTNTVGETHVTDQPLTGATGRQPTMADVAAQAGVSRALVSTVFRGVPGASATTRERVLQAAADLGYRMDNRARLLRQSRTRQLGVVYQLQDAFHADLVEAIYAATAPTNYSIVLSATTAMRPETQAIGDLLDYRCEALLLVSPQVAERDIVTLAERMPVVVLARRIDDPAVSVVRTADDRVVDVALDHLVQLGHRNIAHVNGGRIHGSTDRQRAYRKLMRGRGLGNHVRVYAGGNTQEAGMRAAESIADDPAPLPTAVITFNDQSAIGLMLGLRQAKIRVPQDVSVVGYDDMHMASLPVISLTTVGQDAAATAQLAVNQAVDRLDNGLAAGRTTLVAPYLAVRTSTLPAASNNPPAAPSVRASTGEPLQALVR